MASLATRPIMELAFETRSSDPFASMVAGHAPSLNYFVKLSLAVSSKRERKQATGQKAVLCGKESHITSVRMLLISSGLS